MSSRSKFIWFFVGSAAFASAFILDILYWKTDWKFISIGGLLFTILLILMAGLLLALIPFRRIAYKDKLVVSISIASVLFLVFRLAAVVDYEFGLTDQYNYFTAQQDIKNGKVQIISIGLPMLTGYEEEEAAIERDFGYKSIWRCIYSSRGYYWYNNAMYKYLDKKNGHDWQDRLRQKLNSLRNTRSSK
jgi:hypothetical protein